MTPSSFPSLPDFSAAPSNADGDPQLATLLASVATPAGSAPGDSGHGPTSPEFARWLAQPMVATAPTAPEPGPGIAAPAAPGLLLGEPRLHLRMTVRSVGVEATPLLDEVGAVLAPVEPEASAMQPSAARTQATREELEAAAALLAPLGQALVAVLAATEAPASAAGSELVALPSGAAGAHLPRPSAAPAEADAPQVRLTLQPGTAGAGPSAFALPSSQVEVASVEARPTEAPGAEHAESGGGRAAGGRLGATLPPAPTADLAEWVRRGFATLAGAQGAGAPGSTGIEQGNLLWHGPESLGLVHGTVDAEPQATVAAELALADGTTLRIEVGRPLAGPALGGTTERPLAFEARRPLVTANNAGLPASDLGLANSAKSSAEKTFLSDNGEVVAEGRQAVGIAVAETVGTMLFRPRSLPNDVPGAAAAIVLGSGRGSESAFVPGIAAESVPAPALPLPTATAALAGRAVSTVVNVVETQAASRMQPVPSVQLHFKFGGEDLSVRVELRGGEVRTEFRTDSGALRAALAEEWRAVAAAPATGLRLLEPAFGAAAARGSFDSASTGHQPSSQHHSSQQQHADSRAQQDAQGVFGRVARSFVAPPPASAASPVAPAVASHRANSRHLSVVA